MKKNPQDSTRRNVQASNRRDKALEALMRSLYTDLNKRYNKLVKRVEKLEGK